MDSNDLSDNIEVSALLLGSAELFVHVLGHSIVAREVGAGPLSDVSNNGGLMLFKGEALS